MSENKLSFYLIVISQGVGLVGGAILRFAISLHVLDLTGSAEIFATMVAIAFLPMVLFQPIGGALADRFSKKMIIVVCDNTKTLLAAGLAFLLFGGNQSIILLGAVMALLTLIGTCYHPTATASLPAILKPEELPKANGIVQGLNAVASMAGPVLAGFLFGAVGMNNLVVLCASFFLASAILNIFLKIPYSPQERKGGILGAIASDIRQGFLHVTRENTSLRTLTIIFAFLIFFYQPMLSVTFPFTIRVALGMSEEFFGFANAGIGASILLGSFVAGKLKNFMKIKHLAYYIAILGVATVPVPLSMLLPLENSLAPYLLLTSGFMLIMFIVTLVNVLVMTYIQTHVAVQMVGKAVGITFGMANISAPIGQLILGRLIEGLADAQFVIYLLIALLTFALGVTIKKRLAIFAKTAGTD